MHYQGRESMNSVRSLIPTDKPNLMNSQLKEIAHDTKTRLFAGIDVGAEELVLVIRKNNQSLNPQTFSNTPSDRTRLVNKLTKLSGIIVCLEATGIYHFDLSLALHDAGVSLMVLNPKASHHFAKVLMKNSKTDAVDANTLAEYAERMTFVAWTRPSSEKIALRGFARRIHALRQSGQWAGKTHIAKNGDAALRKALYMPALVAWQHNPPIRTFCQRLKANGKNGKAIVCAAMRKLIHLAFAILKSGQPFAPNYAV